MQAAEAEVRLKEEELHAKEAILAACTVWSLCGLNLFGKAAQTAQTAVVCQSPTRIQ